MKDFICKKCGNTTYIMQEKLNGTGKAIGLYCAKCGTWHKWLNKQEKVLYSTHSAGIDYVADSKAVQTITDLLIEFDEMGFAPTTVCPDGEKYAVDWRERVRKEFARLAAENKRLKEEAAEQKSIADHEHATQMEWFSIAGDYKAEAAAMQKRLDNAVELPAIVMINRTLVNGKFKPTQKAQAFNGRIGVVYRDTTRWNGLLVDICSEKTNDYEPAYARLAELKGGNE